jgi:tetratricopeptide (TPR) repeat protein
MALDPHSPDVLVTFGRLEHRLGRHESAIAALSRSLALRPQNPDALLSLGRAYEAEGRFDEALETAQELVRLQPGSWLGHNRVAMVHFRRGDYEHALAPWEKVLELTPDNGNVLANLGSANFQIGRLDEALSFYERALAISPTAVACSGAGTVLFFQGRASEAVRYFLRGVSLSPRDPRAWGNLGDAQRWVTGAEAESRTSFDRAIELARAQECVNPHDAENEARLALWLAKRGRAPEALAALERALELAPDHPGVLGRAVSVHLLAGDAAKARECLPRALARGYSWVELRRDRNGPLGRAGARRKRGGTMKLSNAIAPVRKPLHKGAVARKPAGRTITVDVSGKGANLSDRAVTVDKAKDHRLRWVCKGGLIRIAWEEKIVHLRRDPNPFDPTGFQGPPKQSIASGKIKGRSGHYKYTLYAYPDSPGHELITIDPQVDVIDTGKVQTPDEVG